MLVVAGTSHLTFAREDFKAQVPRWLPLKPDTVVLQSGVVEIGLGAALVLVPRQKAIVGRIAVLSLRAFSRATSRSISTGAMRSGWDTDGKRLARLFFQPALVRGHCGLRRRCGASGARTEACSEDSCAPAAIAQAAQSFGQDDDITVLSLVREAVPAEL